MASKKATSSASTSSFDELFDKPGFREWLEQTDFTHMLKRRKKAAEPVEAEAGSEQSEQGTVEGE